MAPPSGSGFFRLYPLSTIVSILSGTWSVTEIGAPPPVTTAVAIGTYLNAGVDDPTNAVRPNRGVLNAVAPASWIPFAATYELQFFPDTTRIVFNPSDPDEQEVDFLSADFPIGTVFNQLIIWWNGSYTSGPGRDIILTSFALKYGGSTIENVTILPNVTFNGDEVTGTTAIIPFSQRWGPVQTFKPFGLSFVISGVISGLTPIVDLRTDLFFLQGVYNTEFFDLDQVTATAGPGGQVTIDSPGGSLDSFDSFKVAWYDEEAPEDTWIDSNIPFYVEIPIPNDLIFVHTATQLVLKIPYLGVPFGGTRLQIIGVPTGLTIGDIIIAQLNILLVDGSGIYTIVPGKTNDTYYDRTEPVPSPVPTIDLKIPDPFAKTGFFNG